MSTEPQDPGNAPQSEAGEESSTPVGDIRDAALRRAYQLASATEAGGPGVGTRAAIMADARRVASQRWVEQRAEGTRLQRTPSHTPRSHEPRWWTRAAAALAVLSVGLLWWRMGGEQSMPKLAERTAEAPAELSQDLSQELLSESSQPLAVAADGVVATAQRSRNSNIAPADRQGAEFARRVAAPPASVAPAVAEAADSVAAKSVADPRRAAEQVQLAAVPPPSAAALRAEATEDNSAGAQLLARHFPEHAAGALPSGTLWVLHDAGGAQLQKGVLPAGGALAEVRSELEAQRLPQRVGEWQIHRIATDAGEVTLALAIVQ